MKVGPFRSLGRGFMLVAALTFAASSVRAQFVWDGTTALAATSLGGNTLGSGATLAITTGNNHDFNGLALVNNGTVTWTGAGTLRTGSTGSFTNNAAFNDGAATNAGTIAGVTNPFGGTATFTNSSGATYTKTSLGTTQFGVTFNNSGTVAINSGTLQLTGGGTLASSGTISAASGAAVDFNSGSYTLASGSTLSGAGTFKASGATLTASGTIAAPNFVFSGGTLAGTQTFSGNLTWSNGSFSDNGTNTTTIDATGTLTITTGNNHDFNAHAIVNNGAVTWDVSSSVLRSGNGATFTNNGAFTDASATNANSVASMNNVYGGAATFTNSAGATYTKTSAGTTEFDVPFNNSGTVTLSAGTLNLAGGGSFGASGTIAAASGTQVLFSNNYSLVNGASLTGAGAFQVNSGTFNVTGTVGVSNFTLNGGTLTGTNTFNGAVTWTNGTWNDTGTTTTIGTATGGGATLTLTSGNVHDFNAHAIVNNGTATWAAGAGALRAGNNATFTNNGAFVDAAASAANITASMNSVYGGTTTFTNSVGATYTKTSVGTTQIDHIFNNSGTVTVNAGTLTFNGNGTLATGATITAASGAQVVFSNSYSLANNSALTGAGTALLTGGTLTATGNITVSNFQFNGGNLAGTQTFTGGLTWNSSTWNDTGTTTTIASGAALSIASGSVHDFNAHAIVNNGTATWAAGAGAIRAGNGATFTNNGAFVDAAASAANTTVNMNSVYGGSTTFTNAVGATYTKTSVGTTQIDHIFNNSGTVTVNAGTLTLTGGGTLAGSGTMSATSGATVLFGNSYTIANGAALNGAGLFSATSGTVNVGGTVSVSNFQLAGATLTGTQTFNGAVTWNSGNLNENGSNTTTIASGATLTLATSSVHDFNAHAIVNNGTTTWAAGAGAFRSGNGGSFTNNSLFLDAAAAANATADINSGYGGAFTFTNSASGIYRKTSAGTTTMSTPFVNSGILDVQAGTLQLLSTSTFNAGSSQTGAGLLQLASGTLTASGAMTFSNFQITGGSIAGIQTFNGTVEWTNGNFNNVGITTIGGTLAIDSGNAHDFNTHSFVNNGTVNWTAGQIRSGNGGAFTNNGTFNDTASNNFNNAYNGALTQFTNAAAGTYNKTAANTTTFDVAVVNAGTLNVSAGTLALNAGGSSPVGALFNVSPGATLSFTGGTFAVANGSGFSGTGTVQIAGGTASFGANVAAPFVQLTGGTLAGTQTFLGNLTWTNGTMNDANTTTTIGAGATLTISSTSAHDFNQHAIVNGGTATWSAGQLRSGNGGTFTNQGTFNDAASSDMNNAYNGAVATFTNAAAGTYNKTAGTTTFNVPFTNAGTVNASSGATLTLASGGTISNNAAFTGAGQTLLTGGTFTATGNFSSTSLVVAGATLTGTFTLSSGTLSFQNGTLNTATPTIAAGATLLYGSANAFDFNAAAIVNNGTFNWAGGAGQIRSGNGGTFTNNGTFLDAASNVVNNAYNGAVATFNNSGTYNKSAVGTTALQIPFTNSGGAVVVSAGVLEFASTFTQSGSTSALKVANGGTLQFDQSGGLNLAAGSLLGNGTVVGNVTSSGVISPSSGSFNSSATPGQLSITGNLTLLSVSSLLFELGGSSKAGTDYDFLSVSGTAALGSAQLNVGFTNGFVAAPGQTFTLLTATGGLSGAFANVPVTGNTLFINGGSFIVNYGASSAFAANSLVLSNFVPVPEPSTWALLATGLGALAVATRRRKS